MGKISGATGIEIYMNILNLMVFFISGIAVYLYLPLIRHTGEKLGKYAPSVSGLVIFFLFAFLLYYFSFDNHPINIYIVYPIVWFLMISASIIGLPAFLNNKLFRFMGKASYSIYLMHGIVLFMLESFGLFRLIDSYQITYSYKFLISISISAFITVAISKITYQYIEVPGMKFGKFILEKRINMTTTAPN